MSNVSRWKIFGLLVAPVAALFQHHRVVQNGTAEKPLAVRIAGSTKFMPMLGFGTSHGGVFESTKAYLEMGGRQIDTAHFYRNHKEVARAIKESNTPREEVWVTSKVWTPNRMKLAYELAAQTTADTENYVDKALSELGLEYVDLMLLHWPSTSTQTDVELWKGLINARNQGKVKSIGVSNYGISDIQAIEEATGVRPAVNQIPYNPFANEATRDLVQWCKAHDVIVEAYNLKGGHGDRSKLEAAAMKHHTTEAQYLLRWAMNQGVVVIPGSSKPEHVKVNFDVPDFITDELDER